MLKRAVQGTVQDADIILLRAETCFDLAALIHLGGKKRLHVKSEVVQLVWPLKAKPHTRNSVLIAKALHCGV